MKKLHRIESREVFPVPERVHYIINLRKGQASFFKQGRDLKDEELGDVIIQLVNAVNAAEDQISKLLTIIHEGELKPDYFDEFEEYLIEHPEDEDFKNKYRIEDIKDALYHAMMKKDEKMISKRLNELNVVTEKIKTI